MPWGSSEELLLGVFFGPELGTTSLGLLKGVNLLLFPLLNPSYPCLNLILSGRNLKSKPLICRCSEWFGCEVIYVPKRPSTFLQQLTSLWLLFDCSYASLGPLDRNINDEKHSYFLWFNVMSVSLFGEKGAI